MTTPVLTSDHIFSDEEICHFLKQMEKDSIFTPECLVYYPYYFLEYEMKGKRWLGHVHKKIGCTIDSISGVGSLIDTSPELSEAELKTNKVLDIQIPLSKAKVYGERFIGRSISYKMKIFRMPGITLTKESLFYRPYWIVKGMKKKKCFHLIVDALTGEFHPVGYK
ncbi:hypothetical protein [Halobacillus litoralis]|uniref:hypothetical protein n=1 Tax=Halobacillus litoralis TaxID=45668 RepID=UPI00136F12B9|nr:hypothetical protein [Halobacillus litoralis]MYL36260.1 hypothetical protein [Halobacillus litoralis]